MADKMTLICQCVTAIAELHCIGVIHGDLKPANILLTRGCAPWELHVADFGMAEVRKLFLSIYETPR
jgi:serine/threonine protein kinase